MNLLTFRNWGLGGGGLVNSYFYHLVKDMLWGSLYTIYLSVLAPKICYEISIAYSAQQIINVLCFHLLFIYLFYVYHMHTFNQFHNFSSIQLQYKFDSSNFTEGFCNIHESHIFFLWRNETSERRGTNFGFQNV